MPIAMLRAPRSRQVTIANRVSPFPFGLGWHPFFVRAAATRIGFRARGVWETDATGLPTRHVLEPPQWRFDPARDPGVATIDNVFTGWDGEATLANVDRGIAVTIRADRAMGCIEVYAPGKSYLALGR
jgi:aldose 1-epimerase